jgi:hypothetical protein
MKNAIKEMSNPFREKTLDEPEVHGILSNIPCKCGGKVFKSFKWVNSWCLLKAQCINGHKA